MKRWSVIVLMTLGALGTSPVRAQFAVIDVNAIVQMAQQLRALQDQLLTARSQLSQAEQQFQSLTGRRGMEQLLSGTVRNYLPTDWAELDAALHGVQSAHALLASQLQAMVQTNGVLTAPQTARWMPAQLDQLDAARRSVAWQQVMSRQALEVSSQRFDALQTLINAIPAATDAKATLDLQARIAAEEVMLQNEHTKLMVLHQTAEAEDRAREQRARELAVANIGSLRRVPPVGLGR
ncbi:MAG: type IV secretion system protein [Gammaproteobacteria bacterium]